MSRINKFVMKNTYDIPFDGLLRRMTDEQLRELFEENDIPTNSDFLAIIDSKVNHLDTYSRTELEQVLEAYFASSPEIAKDWYDKEMDRRASEEIRKSNEEIRQSHESDRQSSAETMQTNINNKIIDVENRMVVIEDEFDSLVAGTGFATVSYVDENLLVKADKSNTYTKAEVDVKIDNVIGGGTGTNVAYGTTVSKADWTVDLETNFYVIDINHGLGTRRFVPTVIDNDTNENVIDIYKLDDNDGDNVIRFMNDKPINATITIINGNATTEIVYAKIDDASTSIHRTWSSSKIQNELNNLPKNAEDVVYDKNGVNNVSDALDSVYNDVYENRESILNLQNEVNGVRLSLIESTNDIIRLL